MADESVLSAEEREAYDQAKSILEWPDDRLLIRAVKHHKNNVAALIEEWFSSGPEKWIKDYQINAGWHTWEEMPGLEATETPGAASSPSFRIEAGEVLYGQTPGTTTGAPTRPPSREGEDQQLQQALQLSLEGQPPPRPSSPGKVHFGPATREYYAEGTWAATTSQYSPPPEDEVASRRSRITGLPAFLRRRPNHYSHMLGGLLVILQRIPAARNALLKTGTDPTWGYQCTPNWWKGEPITGQGQRWEHEVHRLIAFLEETTRSYATADILTQLPEPPRYYLNDEEKEFFYRFVYDTTAQRASDPSSVRRYSVLTSDVEVVPVADLTARQSFDHFGILDLFLTDTNYEARPPKTLYDHLDLVFYPDVKTTAEDIDQGMLAMVTTPSEVITLRFSSDCASNIEIPEVFYLDRYLKKNHERIVELSMDQINLFKRKKKAADMAQNRATFTPSSSNRPKSRQELVATTLEMLKGKIEKMRKHALWRNYDGAYTNGEEALYLPFSDDEPEWSDKEKEMLAHYKTRIKQLEQVIAKADDLTKKFKETVLDSIDAEYEANAAKFTTPSQDEKWNPTHSYTLVGAVIGDNQVLLRWEGELLDDIIQESSPPGAPDMGGWWLKVSYHNRVEYEFMKLNSVLDMWNKSDKSRMLVYATELAMKEESIALSDKLQTFVKADNHFFRKELNEEKFKEPTAEASRKRGVDDEWAGVPTGSGKLQRSASMDTLSSERASAGSQKGGDKEDEEMPDADKETGGDGLLGEKGGGAAGTVTGNTDPGGGDGNGSGSAADPIKISGDGDGMVTD